MLGNNREPAAPGHSLATLLPEEMPHEHDCGQISAGEVLKRYSASIRSNQVGRVHSTACDIVAVVLGLAWSHDIASDGDAGLHPKPQKRLGTGSEAVAHHSLAGWCVAPARSSGAIYASGCLGLQSGKWQPPRSRSRSTDT